MFTATVTENGSTRLLKWKLTYSGLTGKAIGAHVHKGKAGVAGAVLVPLCGPCTSGKTGQVKISKDVADLFEHGLVYVNVHTAKKRPARSAARSSSSTTHLSDDPSQPDRA